MERFEYPSDLASRIRRRRTIVLCVIVACAGLCAWAYWHTDLPVTFVAAGLMVFVGLGEWIWRIPERVALDDRDLVIVWDGESLITQNRSGVGLQEIGLREPYSAKHEMHVIALKQGGMCVRFSWHIRGYKRLQLDILGIPDPDPQSY